MTCFSVPSIPLLKQHPVEEDEIEEEEETEDDED